MKRKFSQALILDDYGGKKPKRGWKKVYRKAKIPKALVGRVVTSGNYGRYAGKNSELKYHDTTINQTYDATMEILGTSTATSINLIPQSSGETDRIGRKCCIKSIYVKGYWYSSATNQTDMFRMQLIQDTQANGAYPSTSLIYQTESLVGFLNLANSSRFKVLKEWRQAMNVNGITTNFDSNTRVYGQVVRPFSFFKKVNIPLEFSGATGAITEIRSNNLFFVGQSLADDITNVVMNVRVKFSDN